MPKDIVLLLDGTSNEISTNRSNIVRLYGTLQKSEDQLVYYDPGVGTFGAANAWSKGYRKAIELWGMASGWGLDANVKEAYRFLVENFERDANGTQDNIFIFGFSRGAYSARVLAGFIHAFGLMEARNLNLLDYSYRAYKAIGENPKAGAAKELGLHKNILRPDTPNIRFLGLFDTVSSIVEWGRRGPTWRSHAHTADNPSVQMVRQAVAIDERRRSFRPQLWQDGQMFRPNRDTEKGQRPQDLREVWFSGVHGDIGGGYPEEQSALAKLPLLWMIEQSRGDGLLDYQTPVIEKLVLGKEGKYEPPNPMGVMQNSMSFGWRIPEGFGNGARRVIPSGAHIHHSALARYEGTRNRPLNIPSDHLVEP